MHAQHGQPPPLLMQQPNGHNQIALQHAQPPPQTSSERLPRLYEEVYLQIGPWEYMGQSDYSATDAQ